MNRNNIIILIPTYNNPTTIKAVVEDVLAHDYKVIVIDDGSNLPVKDLFSEEEACQVYFVRHARNEGKGQAIVSGIEKAKELGYFYVLSMDGDGQHLASEAKHLIEICDGDEIIIGARNLDVEHVPFASKFGRWFSNIWASWDTGQRIDDSLSGYRVYPISILDLGIKTKRFDWEMEVLVRHADAGKLIKEVPIACYYPLAEDRISHFHKFKDTMSIVWVHLQVLSYKGLKGMLKLLSFSKK